MRVEPNKIPEIINSLMKGIAEGGDIFKIDVYVHMLCKLTDTECFFLKSNKSTDFFQNDLELLLDALNQSLVIYEEEEEYEICQTIFTSIDYYTTFLNKKP